MKFHLPAAAGNQLRRCAVSLAAGTLLAVGSGTAFALETTFTGYSNGCFGVACAPVASSGAAAVALDSTGLTYNSSTFSGTTVNGFLGLGNTGVAPPFANVNNLGSFTLASSAAGTNFTGNAFDLLITFTAPAGSAATGSPIFTSVLKGSASTTNNGGVFVDFDNTPKTFTSSAGTFTFQVNDVALITGGTTAITGEIQTSPVPEPETYALFLAGLGAVGFMARRRKS